MHSEPFKIGGIKVPGGGSEGSPGCLSLRYS
jgi:hypothetical protein